MRGDNIIRQMADELNGLFSESGDSSRVRLQEPSEKRSGLQGLSVADRELVESFMGLGLSSRAALLATATLRETAPNEEED